MIDSQDSKDLLPNLLQQNPAPVEKPGQDRIVQARAQVDRIMQVFLKVLPSNYVSQVQGPFYTQQFQAAAERIAEFQISAQEVFADSSYDYTRSEFLFQILGLLVFPDAATDGHPDIPGDISYREFLRRMVGLLLKGSTLEAVQGGVELLTTATVEIIEKSITARTLVGGRSAWTSEDQHTFEVNISDVAGFPTDPFKLLENVRLVLRALKPAHTLYDYRHLFRETLQGALTAESTIGYQDYHYQDLRRYWEGATRISGTQGVYLNDPTLFSDPTRDFSPVKPGAVLILLSGSQWTPQMVERPPLCTDERYPNRYRVMEVRVFPVGDDSIRRKYTTTSGLQGAASVRGSSIFDPDQTQWRTVQEGEIITFTEGPNAGRYRLHSWSGNYGGVIGQVTPPGAGEYIPGMRVAPSLLRLQRRRVGVLTGTHTYEVTVDRLGVQVPRNVVAENVTLQFLT